MQFAAVTFYHWQTFHTNTKTSTVKVRVCLRENGKKKVKHFKNIISKINKLSLCRLFLKREHLKNRSNNIQQASIAVRHFVEMTQRFWKKHRIQRATSSLFKVTCNLNTLYRILLYPVVVQFLSSSLCLCARVNSNFLSLHFGFPYLSLRLCYVQSQLSP